MKMTCKLKSYTKEQGDLKMIKLPEITFLVKERIKSRLEVNNIQGAKELLTKYIINFTESIEVKHNCPDCNYLDGEDLDCETCSGKGFILKEELKYPYKELSQKELNEMIKQNFIELGFDYQYFRKREYPPIEDYIDAVVKNDQEAIQEYTDKCLAIKAKYPKE